MSVARSWRGVFAVALWQVVASGSYYAVFAATASIRADLVLSRYQIGVLLAVLTLGYTVLLFPAGAVVDGYGDRPAMLLGVAGLAAGIALVSQAASYGPLLVAAFLLGGAYATAMPATNRAIAVRAPRERYNLAIGVKQVGVTVGSALAALLVTGLADASLRLGGVTMTWRSALLVVAGCTALVGVGYLLDYEGADAPGSASFPDLGGLTANRTYVLLALAGLFLGAVVFTTTGYLVPFFDEQVGVSVGTAGMALAVMQVTGSAGRIGAGEITDRLPGETAPIALGVLVVQSAVAAVAFVVLPGTDALTGFLVVGVLGVAMLGVTGLYHGTLVVLVPDDESGAATAGGQTTLNVGGLIAPPAFGLLADASGYGAGWWFLGGCAVLAAVLLAAARRQVQTDPAA